MRDDSFALDDAVGIQLALDTDRFILGEQQVRGKMQTFLGDIHELTQGGSVIPGYEAAPGNWDTEVSTLDRHQCILLFRATGNTDMEIVKRPPSGQAWPQVSRP